MPAHKSVSFSSVLYALVVCTALLSICIWFAPSSRAQTTNGISAEALQSQISDSNSQIAQLKKEISQLQDQLNSTSKQKKTLQGAITELNLNIQKITKSITLTNAQIAQKDTEIKLLSRSISTTTNNIGRSKEGVGDTLFQLNAHDHEPPAFMLLSGATLSELFDETNALSALRIGLQQKVTELSALKTSLTTSKTVAQNKRDELTTLQQNLAQQKQSLAIARDTQTQLLKETKNKESNYQALIAQKQAQERKFEQDLANFEAQLNLKVNKGALPTSGTAVLVWPVDQPYITQYFGNTPFATANSQIYSGKGHNAIDLRASPGTPIKAARLGTVLGTGNTDLTCPGASYGKWVFIKHDNGLSTLYAHLSVINVSQGQQVDTGQLIGYSDTTGYATGPHLHFGVYASSGSEIATFPSKSCSGRSYTMPVANVSAYLNPLSYLPPIAQ